MKHVKYFFLGLFRKHIPLPERYWESHYQGFRLSISWWFWMCVALVAIGIMIYGIAA